MWSDFKNNTKRAARLHKALIGTGGGPAVQYNLTQLEQRVLNLIGVQAATGLPIEEAGIPQVPNYLINYVFLSMQFSSKLIYLLQL